MTVKPKYKTRQREEILKYLKTVPGVHVTVGDVCDHFRRIELPIGQTTVYRQLERLVDEGVVNKYIIDGNSPACFEYVPEELHPESTVCFHCKCEQCGRLIHLHCDELSAIAAHLEETHHFFLNPMRTVFYGLCESCMQKLREDADGAECTKENAPGSGSAECAGGNAPQNRDADGAAGACSMKGKETE